MGQRERQRFPRHDRVSPVNSGGGVGGGRSNSCGDERHVDAHTTSHAQDTTREFQEKSKTQRRNAVEHFNPVSESLLSPPTVRWLCKSVNHFFARRDLKQHGDCCLWSCCCCCWLPMEASSSGCPPSARATPHCEPLQQPANRPRSHFDLSPRLVSCDTLRGVHRARLSGYLVRRSPSPTTPFGPSSASPCALWLRAAPLNARTKAPFQTGASARASKNRGNGEFHPAAEQSKKNVFQVSESHRNHLHSSHHPSAKLQLMNARNHTQRPTLVLNPLCP